MHLELHTIHWFIHIFEKGEFHEAELNNDDGDRCSLLHIQRHGCPNSYVLEESMFSFFMIAKKLPNLDIDQHKWQIIVQLHFVII